MKLENSIVHFEIPADDVKRSQEFYKKAFNWKMHAYPEMDYTIVETTPVDEKRMYLEKGAINGGMMKKNDKIKSPVLVINVPSVDQAVKNIEKAKGKIVVPKMKVGEMGYLAYFMDTEGNVLGVWEEINKK